MPPWKVICRPPRIQSFPSRALPVSSVTPNSSNTMSFSTRMSMSLVNQPFTCLPMSSSTVIFASTSNSSFHSHVDSIGKSKERNPLLSVDDEQLPASKRTKLSVLLTKSQTLPLCHCNTELLRPLAISSTCT